MRRVTYRIFYTGVWWRAVAAAKGRPTRVDFDGSYVEALTGRAAALVVCRLLLHGCKVKGVRKVVR
jgi:hypothetical protein